MPFNITKVLLASLLYPVVNFRRVINAVTLPFFIFTMNWAITLKFGSDSIAITWLGFAIQIIAIAMLLVNCIYLTVSTKPLSLGRKLTCYGRVTVLLAGFTGLLFIGRIIFLALYVMLFNLDKANFQMVDYLAYLLSSAVLFWSIMVIPNYIETGKVNLAQVKRLTAGVKLKLLMLCLIYQLLMYIPIILIGQNGTLIYQLIFIISHYASYSIGCFVVALSFLELKDSRPKYTD
ncbi:hypothetical protein [Paraferrimonas sp. SM1919]|uniref:hypothetical protein n=1 Tax=Paraferrimonas sp. SM1919 TaxID=2662263 RepID=UPI0013D49898|nr:hypothetical protein [Paraferrimonas sp. SM1919]